MASHLSSGQLSNEKLRSSIFLFSFAFGRQKCYYSHCFNESDSWDMIFDILAVVQMTARRLARIG